MLSLIAPTAAGRSVLYLDPTTTRAFRERYRMTVASYIRHLRLDWAARRITSTDMPLSEIASDAGFSDQSHFTREFKRHIGDTPGEYRLRFR